MASTSKFPFGLNNWIDSDKPTRIDFVSDNEILDENVLWKSAYDSTGEVAEAGGITGYAMTRDAYDEDGSIAAAGGIAAAIAVRGEAICVYTHTKTGVVHSLVLANGTDNIKFVATADFELGDSLLVNGVAVSVLDSDGAALDCPFHYGDVVLMLRTNNVVRVISPLANKASLDYVDSQLANMANKGDMLNFQEKWTGSWTTGSITIAGASECQEMICETNAGHMRGIKVNDEFWLYGGLPDATAGIYVVSAVLTADGDTLTISRLGGLIVRYTGAITQLAITISKVRFVQL